jgi:hypothetical protein
MLEKKFKDANVSSLPDTLYQNDIAIQERYLPDGPITNTIHVIQFSDGLSPHIWHG